MLRKRRRGLLSKTETVRETQRLRVFKEFRLNLFSCRGGCAAMGVRGSSGG